MGIDDWRLQGQGAFLKSVSFTKKVYRCFRDGWDHDHCEFCGSKFSEQSGDLHTGYATSDNYHWVCEPCFNDFRDAFQWTLMESQN